MTTGSKCLARLRRGGDYFKQKDGQGANANWLSSEREIDEVFASLVKARVGALVIDPD